MENRDRRELIKESIKVVLESGAYGRYGGSSRAVSESYRNVVIRTLRRVFQASRTAQFDYSDTQISEIVDRIIANHQAIQGWTPTRGGDCNTAINQLSGRIHTILTLIHHEITGQLGNLRNHPHHQNIQHNNLGLTANMRNAVNTLQRQNSTIIVLLSDPRNITEIINSLTRVLSEGCRRGGLNRLLTYHLPLGIYKATVGWWNPLDMITYEGKSLSELGFEGLQALYRNLAGGEDAARASVQPGQAPPTTP